MSFDLHKFQALNGADLANYTLLVSKEGLNGQDVISQISNSLLRMDDSHIESALYLLGKSSIESSHKIIANYLDYSNISVRFLATKIIASMPSIDSYTMQKVVDALSKFESDPLVQYLTPLLNRPANPEAREIASRQMGSKTKRA